MGKKLKDFIDGFIYIYCLKDPRDMEIRYIGATKSISQRYSQHISKHERKNKNPKTIWLDDVIENGFNPILETIEIVEYEIWEEKEIYWISYYKNEGCLLTNTTRGGKGMTAPISEKTKKKMSISKIGVKMDRNGVEKSANGHRGKKKSKEIRKHQSDSQRIPFEVSEEEIIENYKNNSSVRWQGRKGKKEGYVGVTKRENGFWRARITWNKKCISIGTYDTEIEAAIAYNEAALKYFGPNAKINIIE